MRLKIPPSIAVCPMDGEPLSTDGQNVKCRSGCESAISTWNRKVVQFAKNATRTLKRYTTSEDESNV